MPKYIWVLLSQRVEEGNTSELIRENIIDKKTKRIISRTVCRKTRGIHKYTKPQINQETNINSILSLFFGIFSLLFPPVVLDGSTAGYGYHFITMGNYLINSTILFAGLSMFVIAISNFISLFLKRTFTVFTASALILVGGYWLNGRKVLAMSPFSPFTYFNIPKIVNGEMAATLNDPRFSMQTGMFVLLSVTFLLMALGFAVVHLAPRISKGIGRRK